MRLSSYHIHTTFCDGKNSPEEMVLAAIGANMSDLGFSAHAAWFFSTEFHMQTIRYAEYLEEIARLKTKYAPSINILCGFEAEYLPKITFPDSAIYARFSPDFLIGSVHYIAPEKKGGPANLWCVDAAVEDVARGLAECFDNDGKRAVQAYWRTMRNMIGSCDFDIIGHLDAVRKRNGILHFFDETDSWYRKELEQTAKTIARSGKIVELNTGGMARKAIDGIYPSDDLLAILYKHGVPITISSDAHSCEHIAFAYDKARESARKAGYTTLSFKNKDGWEQEEF